MAIGIAGDSQVGGLTTAQAATAAVSSPQALDLLTQLLIELRTLTQVTTNLNPVPAQDLGNIRTDQDLEIQSSTAYLQG